MSATRRGRTIAAMRALGGLAVAVVLGIAAPVRAEPPEPGTWQAGATSTTVKVERWDAACGEAPKSSRTEGGGTVTLRREGSGIVVDARGREIRTGTCWSRNPSIRRVATQAGGGRWTTQCGTPQGDPHEEQGRYTFSLSPSGALVYEDESSFHWKLGNAVCAATTTTTQTLTRIETPVEEPPPGAESSAAAQACTPGPATQIALRPAHASIELGERVCFRVNVTDAAGCALPRPPLRWSLERAEGITARLDGECFVAGERAAEAEGTFRVVATSGETKATATIQVKAADLSSLLAKRVEEAAAEEAPPEPPAPPVAPPAPAAKLDPRAHAAGAAETDRLLGIASACALVVVTLAWVLLVRARRRREAIAADAAAIEAASLRPPAPSVAPAADNWICPTCRVGYPESFAACPNDGTALVPWRQFAESRRPTPLERGKRCPKCGRRYEAAAAFCTDDGAVLVTMDSSA